MRAPLVLLLLGIAAPAIGATSIVNSVHNLSAYGPGAVRSVSEEQVCKFCHTPHNATPVQPLWNRQLSPAAYKPYSSRSLSAKPGQPTGSSKLCLSCHDGTIALGAVVSPNQIIPMAGGMVTLPPGKTNLGTDLSDDHPISFKYDATLVGKNPKLKDPALLPITVKLDRNLELQCSTCHDAHDNTQGKFLVMDNSSSQLCNTCHQSGTTTVKTHQNCSACHQSHTAPSGPMLLKQAKVADTCNVCHGTTTTPPQGPNIASDLKKISIHETYPGVNIATNIPNDNTCIDCHQPHTMQMSSVVSAPIVKPNAGKIGGVNASGSTVATAQYEYEMCFKCHAEQNATIATVITRKIVQTNTRLEFAQSPISSHPVTAAGAGTDVPSLKPGLTTSSIIYCTDCHASDTGTKVGGTGANGPHGSAFKPLLKMRYDTTDNTAESASAYALCYSCHDQAKLMAETGPFPLHKKHVQEKRAPCSICHDAHGISSTQGTVTKNAHLINFNSTVVLADPVTKKLEYNRAGPRTGSCYLSCHGKPHSPLKYPN